MAAVQKLYEACKFSFTAAVPPVPLVVKQIRHILDSIKASDVGLTQDMLRQQERGFGFFGLFGSNGRHSSSSPRWAPPVSYLHLHESEKFSMGVFCLPTSSCIPLHDHPDMTVFSRLLEGTLHVRSYDWVETHETSDPSKPRLAKLVLDQVISGPCESVVLFPSSGGNIHAFTAISSCAILDVLTPPYSPADGRHCTYYRTCPHPDDGEYDEDKYVYLVECRPPDDFVVKNAVYKGPRIQP